MLLNEAIDSTTGAVLHLVLESQTNNIPEYYTLSSERKFRRMHGGFSYKAIPARFVVIMERSWGALVGLQVTIFVETRAEEGLKHF
jgi:hypothetical protein